MMDTDYWREMVGFIEKMARVGTISADDLDLIYVTDSVEDAIAHIREKAIKPFGLKPAVPPNRSSPGKCQTCGAAHDSCCCATVDRHLNRMQKKEASP